MSHPFGDLLAQALHRKRGLSQSKLADGILQSPSIITEMGQGKRLNGPQARERVVAIIGWLQQQGALDVLNEANALLNAAGMSPLQERDPAEANLIQELAAQSAPQQRRSSDTPPIPARSPYTTPRHNLPSQLTPFIGRAEQLAQLAVQCQARRLLTLTGAGGVGKTRLALQLATQIHDRFADGIWFVDLAPLSDPGSIVQRILDLFRLPEQPDRSPLASLTAYLSSRHLLLILDNCEHLIAACAELAEAILQSCPQVSLLATSREALNIGGELPWRVPSLTRPLVNQRWNRSSTPAQSQVAEEDLLRFEAVALFVAHAHSFQPSFALTVDNAPAIAHICSRLDGIPLALEMAAARVNVFTVEELARRLDGVFDKRFQLLTSGARTAPHRQQTLRATLEWSYGLLTTKEQCLLVCLSVFSGGWTFAAAEEVTGCSLDLMAQLVNKSLVIADQQAGQTRYRLLEMVRQFAVEQGALDEQAYQQAQAEHSRYYLTLLGEQERPLESPQQRISIDIIRADFENISVAWRWAVQAQEFILLAPAIYTVFLYCEVRGNYSEGINLLSSVATELGMAATTSQPDLQLLLANVLLRLGACEVRAEHYESGIRYLQQGLGYDVPQQARAFALTYIGVAARERGELVNSKTIQNECLTLSRQARDRSGEARALSLLNNEIDGYTKAIENQEKSLALWREVGRPDRIAEVSGFLAWYICCQGNYAQADAYWQENIEIYRTLGMQYAMAWAFDCLGWSAWCQNDLVMAQKHQAAALALYRAIGTPSQIAMCLAEMAIVLRSSGDDAQAVATPRQAVALVRDAENHQFMFVLSLNYYGAALIGAGDTMAARQVLSEACQRAWNAQYTFFLMNTFYYFAELLMLESRTLNQPLALEHIALAVTLLTCVRIHPSTWQIYRDKAAQLQAEIEGELPAEVCATAIARGQSCTLEEIVSTLLKNEPDARVDDPKEAVPIAPLSQ